MPDATPDPAGTPVELAQRLTDAGTDFVIEPYVRFSGEPGEQWTMFFLDPSGNAMEFKAFADDAMIFATAHSTPEKVPA